MKRLWTIVIAVLLFAVTFISGCISQSVNKTQTAESDISSVSVYYIRENSADLVAESINVPDTSKKGQIKFLIEQLINPPSGKISPLCDGTELRSVSIKNEIAVIDFSEEFLKDDDLKKTLAPVAVAKTLCSLSFISGTHIFVEGQEATGADGKPLGILRESDLVLGSDTPAKQGETVLTLYFSDDSAEFLVPERRTVEIAAGDTVEKNIINELLKGPQQSGHFKTISSETKLLSIETKNNVCFVNFSKEFVDKHSGGTSAERLTIYSIVNSLTELNTIDKVQFLIEGKKREEFVHMVLNEPIVRETSIVKQ